MIKELYHFTIMNNNFETWMIVYCENIDRVKYYNRINKKIRTNLFPAIDSIKYYDKYADIAIGKNYCTLYYKNMCDSKPGKLGCNLSHQMLLEIIAKESTSDWNLILEDDVSIDYQQFVKEVDTILEKATENKSFFIQLYTHPKFYPMQTKKEEIYKNLYKMAFQWGTCAYFIHKSIIKDFIDCFPLRENIDIEYGKKIRDWNSLCWLNNGIETQGSLDNNDKASRLGSLIN